MLGRHCYAGLSPAVTSRGCCRVAIHRLPIALAPPVAERRLWCAQASGVVARGLSSCGAWARLLRGMWDLPRPGIEPRSLALQGRFLTTGLPGKHPNTIFFLKMLVFLLGFVFNISIDVYHDL